MWRWDDVHILQLLQLENAGVQCNERGQVEVNDQLQTATPHIYAIGDVVRGAMLAHVKLKKKE